MSYRDNVLLSNQLPKTKNNSSFNFFLAASPVSLWSPSDQAIHVDFMAETFEGNSITPLSTHK